MQLHIFAFAFTKQFVMKRESKVTSNSVTKYTESPQRLANVKPQYYHLLHSIRDLVSSYNISVPPHFPYKTSKYSKEPAVTSTTLNYPQYNIKCLLTFSYASILFLMSVVLAEQNRIAPAHNIAAQPLPPELIEPICCYLLMESAKTP